MCLKIIFCLGVVSFDDTANRVLELTSVSEQNKEFINNTIKAIKESGETNTFDGLLAGLQMAYEEGRRTCVMLFTDGNPNAGNLISPDDIVRKIVQEKDLLEARSPRSQIDLHTFGIFGYHDRQDFLLNLATIMSAKLPIWQPRLPLLYLTL